MHKFFVYLIVSENRLVILKLKNNNPDYFFLMDVNGDDVHHFEYLCKTFCLGFILGAKFEKKPINDLCEFK